MEIEALFNGQEAEKFEDFLIGGDQPPIKISIAAEPNDAIISWEITPIGIHSGIVKKTIEFR